jgi:2-polyprenyl-3-methyl-5-hydroxy-6-metoxy-1,4-benzoquinol methylase
VSLGDLRHVRALARSLDGFARLHLLRTGVELGLFEALRTPRGEEELADRLGLARDLVSAWLNAARTLGLVRRSERGFSTGDLARWLLDADQAEALHALLAQAIETYGPRLRELPVLMKGGERPRFGSPEEAMRTAAVSRAVEPRALAALARIPGVREARRVLDVGCGHGTYLAGLLARYRDAHGVGIELDAAVADEARRRLREAEVFRRGEIRVGDVMTLDLSSGTFDLALLNNNVYYFAPDQRGPLLRRVRSVLVPRGVVAIQTPVLEMGLVSRALGVASGTALFDLVLRAHGNLHGLPDPASLHAALRGAGFAETGEVPIVPGGTQRYVWGRVGGS